MIDLSEIQERCDAATKGPWTRVPQTRGGDLIAHEYETGEQMSPKGLRLIAFMMTRGNSMVEDEANADLIIHARQDIPALLSEVSALRERVSELENIVGQLRDQQSKVKAQNALGCHNWPDDDTAQRCKACGLARPSGYKALAPREAKEKA